MCDARARPKAPSLPSAHAQVFIKSKNVDEYEQAFKPQTVDEYENCLERACQHTIDQVKEKEAQYEDIGEFASDCYADRVLFTQARRLMPPPLYAASCLRIVKCKSVPAGILATSCWFAAPFPFTAGGRGPRRPETEGVSRPRACRRPLACCVSVRFSSSATRDSRRT